MMLKQTVLLVLVVVASVAGFVSDRPTTVMPNSAEPGTETATRDGNAGEQQTVGENATPTTEENTSAEQSGEFTVTHAVVCTPVVYSCVGQISLESGDFVSPAGAASATVTVTWEPENPTAESLHIFVSEGEGDDAKVVGTAEGPSPLMVTLPDVAPEQSYHVYAWMAPPGGVATDQQVRWTAVFSP